MSAVRFYVDEDAEERAVVQGLRTAGIDVLTVSGAGMDCETDEAQLLFAASQGRSLYSLNVGDFSRIHREFLSEGKEHAGIVLIPRQRYTTRQKIRQLTKFVAAVTAEEMKDRLEFL